MRKSVLLYTLSLTALLAACGGGGGSGRNVPVSSLPSNTTIKTANSDITTMSSDSFSNEARRQELYDNAVTANASSDMHTMSVSTPDIDTAYGNMKKWLIDDESLTDVDAKDLRLVLIMIGFDDKDLPADSQLKVWTNHNSPMIKNKAHRIYDMYGKKKKVHLDNATLNSVDINTSKQDSFLYFTVDDKDKITGMDFAMETDSSGSRIMHLNKTGKNEFTRTGDLYTLEFPLADNSRTLEIELLEDIKESNIDTVKKKLIAKLYESAEKHSFSEERIAATKEKIENLDYATFEQMKNDKQLKYFGGKTTIKVTYKSYAKETGTGGLAYSDFGVTEVYGNYADERGEIVDKSVFAGGYDVKRISADKLKGKMEFNGKAVATALYQKENGDSVENRDEKAAIYEGTSNLVFDNGKETLNTKFSDAGWYDVKVETNAAKDNYDITFSGGDKIKGTGFSDFKFNNDATYKAENLRKYEGDDNGSKYGTIDIGYYGKDKTPTEATGYVTYGESKSDHAGGADSLHLQIGFGAKRK